MLNIQKWLITHNFNYDLLNKLYGIDATFSDCDDRVILNYSQINSPKYDQIVNECRGIVLDKTNACLIARAFNRFYNFQECDHKNFKFDNCYCSHKEDGSLILLYYYNNNWFMNTRASFGNGEVCEGMTWRNLFNLAFDNSKLDRLEKNCTYVFELCSRYNKVVRDYPSPKVYLLSVYNVALGIEYQEDTINLMSNKLELERPKNVVCKDIYDAQMYVSEQEVSDKTFEGLVLRDLNNLRVKLKSASYVALHRLANNHQMTLERAWDIIVKGEESEFLVYFPELRDMFDKVARTRLTMQREFGILYESVKGIQNQKEFALAVKDSRYAAACFAMRKFGVVEDETWFRIFKRIYNER